MQTNLDFKNHRMGGLPQGTQPGQSEVSSDDSANHLGIEVIILGFGSSIGIAVLVLHLGVQEDTTTTQICAMLVSIVEDSAWDTLAPNLLPRGSRDLEGSQRLNEPATPSCILLTCMSLDANHGIILFRCCQILCTSRQRRGSRQGLASGGQVLIPLILILILILIQPQQVILCLLVIPRDSL